MTLLTVPWPLPKASVEYAWVQPHKLQLSALKSVGSPTQQMGRGSERKLTERERAEKRKLVWLIFNGWKINQISSLFASAWQRQRQEGVCSSRHADSNTRARVDFVFRAHACACMQLFVHLNMEVLSNVCMQVLLWVSVHIILPEALDSCQATVAEAGSALGLDRHFHMPMVFDKRHRSAQIHYQVRVASG